MTSAASPSGLVPAGTHNSLPAYVRNTWSRRAYLWHVPRNELSAQQMNTVLGNAWHLLNPILQIAIYYLIFGVILDVSRGSDNYITFLAIGVFVFQFSQRSVTSGASSLVSNVGLIRSINFPRVLLPLAAVSKQLMQHGPAFVVMLATALVTGEPLRLIWLVLPLVVALQTMLNAGLGIAAARLTHSVPDVQNILPFVFRLLFYASGVLFSVELRAKGRWPWMFRLNPFYDIIEIHRSVIMDAPLHNSIIISAVVWTVVSLVVGVAWFHRNEALYGARH